MLARGWAPARGLANGASEVADKALGIIGVGAVGAEIARIARQGLRMRVSGFQRHLSRLPAEVIPSDLAGLLGDSDFVVLCCPLTPETSHLIDASRLSQMKSTAYLVNVSRGAVIDEIALVDALQAGTIAGAALDVFEEQPLSAPHPLAELPNVILTPHLAGITAESMRRMSRLAAEAALRLLSGELPVNLVNAAALAVSRPRSSRRSGPGTQVIAPGGR